MTVYLTEEQALLIADEEGFVIQDLGLLASAVARPQTAVFGVEAYPDLWTKAASLLESVSRNHAVLDGNKRLALLLTDVFLGLNGRDLQRSDEHADYVVAVCQGQMDLPTSAAHLEAHSARAVTYLWDDDAG